MRREAAEAGRRVSAACLHAGCTGAPLLLLTNIHHASPRTHGDTQQWHTLCDDTRRFGCPQTAAAVLEEVTAKRILRSFDFLLSRVETLTSFCDSPARSRMCTARRAEDESAGVTKVI